MKRRRNESRRTRATGLAGADLHRRPRMNRGVDADFPRLLCPTDKHVVWVCSSRPRGEAAGNLRSRPLPRRLRRRRDGPTFDEDVRPCSLDGAGRFKYDLAPNRRRTGAEVVKKPSPDWSSVPAGAVVRPRRGQGTSRRDTSVSAIPSTLPPGLSGILRGPAQRLGTRHRHALLTPDGE